VSDPRGAARSGDRARLARVALAAVLVAAPLTPARGQGEAAAAAAEVDDVRDFDHFRTGFPLSGAHERVQCEDCHVRGIFAGTPIQCSVCHGTASEFATSRKPPNHVATSHRCEDCHVTGSWTQVRFEHAEAMGSCQSCHNGVQAGGKHPSHIPSSDNCEDCHRTLTWLGARFDHAGITSSCFSCHNGSIATAKSANHIPSGIDCETCHSTSSWSGARFDHAGITTGCFNCHNGSIATGKSANHVPSGNDCETCHSTRSWLSSGFDHTGITTGCFNCHNGSTATGMSAGHFVTTLDCALCHSTSSWTPITFRHASPGYPGDHAVRPACIQCHQSNSQVATWTFPQYAPDCAGCHAGDFRPDKHPKSRDPLIPYSLAELRDCTGACHEYTDGTFTTVETTRSGEHSVSRGEW
jgi:hypothetical protein